MHCTAVQKGDFRRATRQHNWGRFYNEDSSCRRKKSQGKGKSRLNKNRICFDPGMTRVASG